jgi:hypothetical protein
MAPALLVAVSMMKAERRTLVTPAGTVRRAGSAASQKLSVSREVPSQATIVGKLTPVLVALSRVRAPR